MPQYLFTQREQRLPATALVLLLDPRVRVAHMRTMEFLDDSNQCMSCPFSPLLSVQTGSNKKTNLLLCPTAESRCVHSWLYECLQNSNPLVWHFRLIVARKDGGHIIDAHASSGTVVVLISAHTIPTFDAAHIQFYSHAMWRLIWSIISESMADLALLLGKGVPETPKVDQSRESCSISCTPSQ